MEQEWKQIFLVISWIYSLSWTFNFYGQIVQNYKLKSVEGMNLNYALLNINGFCLYSIYNIYGYFIDQSQTGKVQIADLFFAVHALGATAYMIFQAIIYPKGSNTLANITKKFIICQWIFVLIYYLLIKIEWIQVSQSFGYISIIGYLKLLCTAMKYIPQLLWNYERRSTHGWSIISIQLDLIGGIFSFLQIILQLVFTDYSLNITKLLLGLLTIIFDVLFIHQHFCLYPSIYSGKQVSLELQQTSPSMSNVIQNI